MARGLGKGKRPWKSLKSDMAHKTGYVQSTEKSKNEVWQGKQGPDGQERAGRGEKTLGLGPHLEGPEHRSDMEGPCSKLPVTVIDTTTQK